MLILVIGADHFNRALGSSPADRPQPIDHTPGGKVISTKPMNSGSAPNARFPQIAAARTERVRSLDPDIAPAVYAPTHQATLTPNLRVAT
jgi:hypothetical protein